MDGWVVLLSLLKGGTVDLGCPPSLVAFCKGLCHGCGPVLGVAFDFHTLLCQDKARKKAESPDRQTGVEGVPASQCPDCQADS